MNEKLISEYAYRVRRSNDLMEVKSLLKQFGEEFCKAAVIRSLPLTKVNKEKKCCSGRTDGYRCADCGNAV